MHRPGGTLANSGEVLRKGDARFDDMVRYMDWASEGLDHRFVVDGDDVVVEAAGVPVGAK